MINKHKVQKSYAAWATIYDQNALDNAVIVKDHPLILELLKPVLTKQSVGLDLGCGTGLLTFQIAPHVQKIVGVDFSDEMLEIARNKKLGRYPNIEFQKADIMQKLPFSSGTFDFVISGATLSHVENLESLYKEIFRVLKPEGIFVFDDITSKLNKSFTPKYTDYLAQFSKDGSVLWSKHSLEEHKSLLQKVGFHVENIIQTTIDDELKGILKPADFKINYGCPFTTLVRARK